MPLQNVAESLRLFFEADVHFSSSVRHPGLPYLSLRLFFEARAHFSGDAINIFRRALAKAYPADVEVILREGLGDALHVTGAYESARQEFERAERLLPPNAFTLHARLLRKRALTLDAQRRLEEALHVWRGGGNAQCMLASAMKPGGRNGLRCKMASFPPTFSSAL